MPGRYGTSGGATFRVEGIEPVELAVHPEAVRRMYWRWVCELVLTAKDRELAAGLDKYGLAMVPISRKTRRYRKSVKGTASPNAPPLTPAYEASRTRSLFDGRAFPDRAEFFWRFDEFTGASWGRILKFHARGLGHLPVRDVIGLSPPSMAWVRQQALARWMTWLRAPTEPPPVRKPKPPAKVPVEPTERINLEHYTFGIGAGREEVQRMIDAGTFSGFRQLHTFKPGTGPSGQQPRPLPPKPTPLPPTPRPTPRPAKGPILVRAEETLANLGVATKRGTHEEIQEAMSRTFVAKNAPAIWDPETNAVFLNIEHEFWRRPRTVMTRLAAQKWFSTREDLHIPIHEAGHARHYLSIGDLAKMKLMARTEFPPDVAQRIRKEVGRYAAISQAEFVAEVFAALRQRRTFSDWIMGLYAMLGGPAV